MNIEQSGGSWQKRGTETILDFGGHYGVSSGKCGFTTLRKLQPIKKAVFLSSHEMEEITGLSPKEI